MLKKIRRLSSCKEGPTTKEQVIVVDELRQKYPLTVILKVSGLSKSTYFYNKSTNDKDFKNVSLMSNINDIFYKHKRRYGYRRITLELRNNGLNINHKKVKRLMSKMGLYSPVRRAKYKSYKGTIGKVAPNILQRNFVADKPNTKWVTDVSEFHVPTGKVYLSPILDLYNSEIVSYSVSTNPSFNQTKEMIIKAFKDKDLNGCILHSDQGWQYQMVPYQNWLKKRNRAIYV